MESVISCVKSKEWTNQRGEKVPIYSIGLSDGRGGESFGKEIPPGTPMADLSIEDGQYGLKIKLKSAGTGGGGFQKQRSGNESFALSYAKDLVVAGKVDIKAILSTADKLYAWLEGKKVGVTSAASVPKSSEVPKSAPMTTAQKSGLPDDDALPF